ncbi:MAG TPA: tripartite tricarboxylate transporter permease [Spirochaetia bacterium]|nr:tripartite tricarboxylate transporter permease [Spirochaetia bacterium]
MEAVLSQFGFFFQSFGTILFNPMNIVIVLAAVTMGIIFGAMPGLTATLGVALLTTLTYGMNITTAMLALYAVYVGAVYGGSYSSILINIPGTAAAAATAIDGYQMALQGKGGKALGLTTSASAIGSIIGGLFFVALSPLITTFALQFTSYEYFLLAFFGIIISGTLQSTDLVYKGWISGFIGLWLSTIGRDGLQFYPRFTFGFPQLDGGIDVVPVLIGAFGIPQIIQVLKDRVIIGETQKFKRILPEFGELFRHIGAIARSALIGVGIGAVPGIGEDIAAWVSYGAAKNSSKHPETFGKGEPAAIISTETANNACVGGASIPLMTLGVPGSPPAAMLLGALMLHGVQPGPLIQTDHPGFIVNITAIIIISTLAMWVVGILFAKQVVKILRIPQPLFMPVIAVLSVIGSYALGQNIFNLYLMVIVGIVAYFLTEMKYPIAPLVIGVILGPMADTNLRRALMVSKGSLMPMFTRPVSLLLILVIVLTVVSQTKWYRAMWAGIRLRLSSKKDQG